MRTALTLDESRLPTEQSQDTNDIVASSLGDATFRSDFHIKFAYLAGAMYRGIASKEMIVALGRNKLMGYFGTGGLASDEIEAALSYIQRELGPGGSYGLNLLSDMEHPERELALAKLYCRSDIRFVEASAFMKITPALVFYRLKGASRNLQGSVNVRHNVLAKVSRPEVALQFMLPAPASIVDALVSAGVLTQAEAELSPKVPIADDVCVEADSGGHTDRGVAYVLTPTIAALRDEVMKRQGYSKRIRVGAAGGIGTPHAAAAAFMMGADFILTGSINQCTVEAGTSAAVKEILEGLEIQDMAYAPAGDMFELGAKVQVVKKGLLFPGRANKLYELYSRYNSLDEIEAKVRTQIEERYFRRTFEDVWAQAKAHHAATDAKQASGIESDPKRKMAAVFKWYFFHTANLAQEGHLEHKSDYQIHCGPALGAFNQWVKGTSLESWRNRGVVDIAERIMRGAAEVMSKKCAEVFPLSGHEIGTLA